MHLCTYTSTEKNRRFYTRLLVWLRWQSIRPFSWWESRGAGSKGWWQWCALTLTHCCVRQSTRAKGWSPPCADPTVSRTTGASPNPPQHPILSTRREAQRCSKSSPRSPGSRDPGATWLSGQRRAGRDEEHLVSTDRATNRLSHQRCRGNAVVTHTDSPCSTGRLSSLVMFFHTFIVYVLFCTAVSSSILIPHAIKYFEEVILLQ